jgi:Tol biopolymer transport system component
MTTPRREISRRLATIAVLIAFVVVAPSAPAGATYSGTNGEIVYVRAYSPRAVDADGSNDRSYTSERAVLAFGFSSDGSQAVVAEYGKSKVRIVLVDVATDARTIVLHATDAPTYEIFSVALSPDGSSIVFCDGFPGHLWTIATDGTALTKIANGYCYADWGVDGRIVASKGIFQSDGDRLITTMDADGGNKEIIATMPPVKQAWKRVYVLRPSWSPDGTSVVFGAQGRLPRPDIWFVNADGTNKHRLTATRTVSEFGPILSPDGLKVVFTKRDKGTPTTDLWTMDADGGNPAQLLDAPDTNEYTEAWRPA